VGFQVSLKTALAEAKVRADRYRPRLTPCDVKELLRDMASGKYTFSKLGSKYGVSAATVSYHVKRAGGVK
jgi:DNA-binding transcriptional ArsR family regulator